MRSRLAPLGALLGGMLLAGVLAATAFAYAGQVAATIQVSGPSGPQACNTPITITALIQDIDGKPIEGQPVTWSFLLGNIAGDTILDATTTTNASGIATTRVQFACSPRSVTIQALADDATGTMVLALSGAGAAADRHGRRLVASDGMLLAALAVLLGSGMMLRRFASRRR